MKLTKEAFKKKIKQMKYYEVKWTQTFVKLTLTIPNHFAQNENYYMRKNIIEQICFGWGFSYGLWQMAKKESRAKRTPHN